MHHAEALLLVNDHQPQVLDDDVVLQQPVRADHDIHGPGRQVSDDRLLGAAGAEAREQFHPDRVIGHALAEGVVVLLRQHGRRHQHGDLFAVHHRLERGADADLRLAEPDVAADQPVHRLGAFHVGLRLDDGALLVGRFLEDEGALELALPGRVRRERMARLRFARGLDGEQVAGDVPHRPFGVGLGLGPAGAAQRVERRARLARADILADQVRLGHRHIELGRRLRGVARRVFDDQAFLAGVGVRARPFGWLCAGAQGQHLQPDIPPNPVLQVDDVVALLQLREINVQGRTRRLRVRRFEAARALHLVTPKDLGVGDHDQPGLIAKEAAGQRA